MNKKSLSTIWIVTEVYSPDETATAHLVSLIAEFVAQENEVKVLCGQPTYTHRGEKAPRHELLNGAEVQRCWSTTFSKDNLLLRVVNMLTINMSMGFRMLFGFKRGDRVLMVTNPPLLPYVAQIIARLRGAKTCLLVHDIYPDVLVPTGFTSEGSMLYRVVNFFNRRLYLKMDRIVTIGRDMEARVVAKDDRLRDKMELISNWCDPHVTPIPKDSSNEVLAELEYGHKFIIQYAGNIGRTHGVEVIAKAAEILERNGFGDKIHWMICGWGGAKPAFEKICTELNLESVTVEGAFPRSRMPHVTGVADVSIITYNKGMAGISVPSRLYNILAAGSPVIAVTDPDAELALVVDEFDLGWISPAEDCEKLAQLVMKVYEQRDELSSYRVRCREIATSRFSRESSLERYAHVMQMLGTGAKQPAPSSGNDRKMLLPKKWGYKYLTDRRS